MNDISENREMFEAWITKDCGDLTTFGHGANMHYRNSAVNNAWDGWKASRKSALKEVIDLVKVLKDNSTDYILDRLMDIIHETNEDQ